MTKKLIVAVLLLISITNAQYSTLAQNKIQNRSALDLSRLLPKLQARLDEGTALQPLVNKAGKLKSRTFRAIGYTSTNLQIVAVDFQSSFSKSDNVTETVLLERAHDGQWRISSYGLH